MSDRSTRRRLKDFFFSQTIKKFVQMALDGFDGLLEDKKHDDRESQLAFAGKVLRSHAMASQENWIVQFGAECFDKDEQMFRNID